jgi:hypothetical protein
MEEAIEEYDEAEDADSESSDDEWEIHLFCYIPLFWFIKLL